jgi:NAD(P)-dependent dehydrogenase (short-subunit alcohol dehydrogenase family)
MLWRYRGTPHYLAQQALRLGMTPVLADRARSNQEIYRVSVLLAQLCERYHKARKEDGKPILAMTELAQVRGTLQQAEQECSKLHALAATAAAMIDEAYSAFETEQPPRHFAVLCDFDTPNIPLPLGDGTVGISTAASTG